MGLLEEVAEDIGQSTAQILALNASSRRWEPSGQTVAVASMDMPGHEIYALGKDASTEMQKWFTNLLSSGGAPLSMKDRVRLENKDWNVVSVQRITDSDSLGAIVIVERTT